MQGLIEGQAGSDFRIDTHKKNKTMRHIVEKLGFVYCGKVPIDGECLAYQKIKQNNENALYQEIDEADYHRLSWLLNFNCQLLVEHLNRVERET